MAEQDGWIDALTNQIFEKAFYGAAMIPDPLTLAVNVSPLQLRDPRLPEQIRRMAVKSGFALKRLVVEITESALIEDLQSAAAIVGELKEMGCLLALDDFGTGYSSLHHLQSLPFDKLKVDRSFVSSMTDKRDSRKIVSAVVGLGQSLGLITVAEGIETQEQAEMMLWLGCELGQGWFYGRPMPADDLTSCVAERREKLITHNESPWKKICSNNSDVSPTQRLAQLQAVYDGAPVGLAFVDQNLRYLNLNKKLADMNGASVEDHLGSQVADMIPDFFPQVEPYIRRALDGEAIADVESKIPATGETRLLSYQPALDEAGEVIGVAIAVADITGRKRTEDALRTSEAHYRRMIEQSPYELWIMDPHGKNMDFSPKWDKKSGLIKPRSIDQTWLMSVHPEDVQPTVNSLTDCRRSGTPIDIIYRTIDEMGNCKWKRSLGSPRFDDQGNIVCWYGSIHDVEAPSVSPSKFMPQGTLDPQLTSDRSYL